MRYYRLEESEKGKYLFGTSDKYEHLQEIALNGNCVTKINEMCEEEEDFLLRLGSSENESELTNWLGMVGWLGVRYLKEIKVLNCDTPATCPELTADWSGAIESYTSMYCDFDCHDRIVIAYRNQGTDDTSSVTNTNINPEDPIFDEIEVLKEGVEALKAAVTEAIQDVQKDINAIGTKPLDLKLDIQEADLDVLLQTISNSIANVSVTAELVANLKELYQNLAKNSVDTNASVQQVGNELQIWRNSVTDFLERTATSNNALEASVNKYEAVQNSQNELINTLSRNYGGDLSQLKKLLSDILAQRQATLRAESCVQERRKEAFVSFITNPFFVGSMSGVATLLFFKLIKEVFHG